MVSKDTEQSSEINENIDDVMSDMRYISRSCSLITDALQKGCDVMQLPNGDIIISELKTITFQYTWDNKRGKLVRTQLGNKKLRSAKKLSGKEFDEDYYDLEDEDLSNSFIKEEV